MVWPGAEQFDEMGCGDCHVPRLEASIGYLPAYTDLLLHDMGEAMADLPVGLASATEFRTQPLWGVTLHAPYLHDGRARSLAEAILWHGGEGEAAKNKFKAMGQADKDALIKFLKSL